MLSLLALLALSAADEAWPVTPTLGRLPERCAPRERRVSRKMPSVGLHKLNEMPDADPQYAVVREIDGCPVPVKADKPLKPQR